MMSLADRLLTGAACAAVFVSFYASLIILAAALKKPKGGK